MRVQPWLCMLQTFVLTLLLGGQCIGQDTTSAIDRIIYFPDKVFNRIDKQSASLEKKIERSTEKYLQKLENRELRLYKKMYRHDSARAKQLFGNVKERYAGIRQDMQQVRQATMSGGTAYNGKLDSLGTTLLFLQGNAGIKEAGAISDKLGANLKHITSLRQSFQASQMVRNRIRERQEFLKERLQNTPLAKEFKKFRKDVYYYQQQVSEYRESLNDPGMLATRLLDVAQQIPSFREFFGRNSQLASLFPLSGGGAPGNAQSLFGLQTRADMQNLLQQRIGNTPAARQQFQQNLQAGQAQLQQLKNKVLNKVRNGGNAEDGIDFKPNNQKTKSFKERLELGANIQSQKPNSWFPVTSDVGLSAGYRLNDRSVIGIGVSYKIGWGESIRNIKVTHQGIGLRSFIDWKLKGSFWLSGGYEQNYRNEIHNIDQLRHLSAWQQSSLVGVSKVISTKTKFLKQTKMQLLWDFLSYRQMPRAQPLVFRIGYSF